MTLRRPSKSQGPFLSFLAETPVAGWRSGAYQAEEQASMRRFFPAVVISAALQIGATLGFAAELSSADRTFVNEAAAGGLAEVQDAQLAQQKSTSSDVKQFAGTMISDHTQANTDLNQIAQSKGITPPNAPTRVQQSAQEDLKKLSGGAFDRQYMKQQVEDHQKTVALFQTEANSGQDAQLKALAQKYLPKLQQHLQMAQSLAVKGL
jgi:predicted outer membrane protein